MRILYLGFSDDLLHCLGVGRKLRAQARCLNRLGVETKGYLLYLTGEGNATGSGQEVEFLKVPSPGGSSLLRPLHRRRAYFAQALELAAHPSWDLIYFRYPFSDLALLRFVRRYPGKVVFEHQTTELDELGLRGGRGMKYYSERWLAPRVFQHAAGSVGVTEEIARYEKARAAGVPNYPTAAIGNGFEVDSVPARQIPSFDGQTLDLLMVATFNPWHGLDRAIEGMARYQGVLKILLHVVGEGGVLEEYRARVRSLGIEDRVIFYGKLTGEPLDRMFDRCHLAISTLGLHRKGMIEASTLKVREYWARGIPIILSERDPDLDQCEAMKPFYWQAEMNDAPLSMQQVEDFARRVLSIPDYRERMVELGRTTIDMSVKMAQLKTFFEKVSAKSEYRRE